MAPGATIAGMTDGEDPEPQHLLQTKGQSWGPLVVAEKWWPMAPSRLRLGRYVSPIFPHIVGKKLAKSTAIAIIKGDSHVGFRAAGTQKSWMADFIRETLR
jgi:hypothetical protein